MSGRHFHYMIVEWGIMVPFPFGKKKNSLEYFFFCFMIKGPRFFECLISPLKAKEIKIVPKQHNQELFISWSFYFYYQQRIVWEIFPIMCHNEQSKNLISQSIYSQWMWEEMKAFQIAHEIYFHLCIHLYINWETILHKIYISNK